MGRIRIRNTKRFAFEGHGIAAWVTLGRNTFLQGPAVLMPRALQMIGIGRHHLPFLELAGQHLGKGLHI